MNTHHIKVIGKAEIDGELDDKKDYSLCYKRLGIRSVNKKPLEENGDYDYTYTLENLDIATLISEGETIQGKAKSISKGLRGAVYYLGQEIGVEDSEEFYQKFGKQIINNLYDIYKMLNK